MTSRFRFLTVAVLVLVGLGACKPDVGVFVTRAGAGSGGTAAGIAAEARALGVHTVRATADVSRPSTLALGRQLHDMGFDVVLTVRATSGRTAPRWRSMRPVSQPSGPSSPTRSIRCTRSG